jgi:hypothetical protein
VLHLHIVNPHGGLTGRVDAWRAAAPGLDLRVSFEFTPAGDAVYYACARFLLLPEILARYRSVVTVIDIDCLFQPAATRLPGLRGAADVALFRLDTVFPWLRHPAAMVIFAESPGARQVAALLQSYLRRKLAAARVWTLDQAALFCVVGAVRHDKPDDRSGARRSGPQPGQLRRETGITVEDSAGVRD